MPFNETIIIILLLIGAAVILIGIIGHAKISAGFVRIDAVKIHPVSRFLLIAAGMVGMLLVLALFPSSLPTYVLGTATKTLPPSSPVSPESEAPPAVIAPAPVQTVQVRDYFLNADKFAQSILPYSQAVFRR